MRVDRARKVGFSMNSQLDANASLHAANEDFAPAFFVHAANLIRLYPNGSPQQLQELIAAYPRLSAMDLAHLLSDSELAPKLEQFRRDHKSTTRTPFRQYALFVVIAVVSIAIILWTMFVAK
jgi:hypothetical protein